MGRPSKQVGYDHGEKTPDSFCKVLFVPELNMLAIPSAFLLPCFDGECPETIKLKASTACIWDIVLKEQDGKIFMDEGWPEFVQGHYLKEGHLVVFKKLATRTFKVVLFDCNCR